MFDALIRSEHGLRLLADAVARGRRGERPRAINEDGVPVDLRHYAENVAGVHNLDKLRLESDVSFSVAPSPGARAARGGTDEK